MPRIRTIKPEFVQSETLSRVSRDARLLFVSLWPFVDDSGRIRGNLRYLSSTLLPYDEDAPRLIETWIAELESIGAVRRYQDADGSSYLDIPKWLEHQKIDKPTKSRLPAFDESSSTPPRTLAKNCSGPRTLDLGPRTIADTEDPGIQKHQASTVGAVVNEFTPPQSAIALMSFPTSGKPSEWALTKTQRDEWQLAYPDLDVDRECVKALQWVKANQRKTARGMPRFLTSWLNRANDRPRPRGVGPAVAPTTRNVPGTAETDEMLKAYGLL